MNTTPRDPADPGGAVVVDVKGLRKSYGDTHAVADISFSVRRGEIFGVLGPNGAGKTTTVETVTGLRTPDAGTVRVLGLDPVRDRAQLVTRVGVQLQDGALPDAMTVIEALRLYASFYDQPADVETLLSDWGLQDKAQTRFKRLSGGQKQRLMIALALVGRPEVVVLDELTTGLDPHARRATWDLVEEIRASGVTVLLVTHFMDEAEHLCDRVMIVDHGRVVALGAPWELAEDAGDATTLRFVAGDDLDEDRLRRLPDVESVHRNTREVVVTGSGDVLLSVASDLAAQGIRPRRLRTEQGGLEDAYLALTGQPTTDRTTLAKEPA